MDEVHADTPPEFTQVRQSSGIVVSDDFIFVLSELLYHQVIQDIMPSMVHEEEVTKARLDKNYSIFHPKHRFSQSHGEFCLVEEQFYDVTCFGFVRFFIHEGRPH